jgi:hypothetical protein
MVKGILADINVRGHVDYLIQRMQAEPWTDFWNGLGLVLRHFEDIGLTETSTDQEVWQRCQAEELVLITDNRDYDSPESLEATIRQHNTARSLPVFTIADLEKFRTQPTYRDQVLISLYDYLLRIDTVRGTGRLFIP